MNLDELQELWNSSVNQPTAEERARIISRFALSVRRRRRQEMAWLAWTFFVLTLLTLFAGWLLFGTNKVDLASEWGVVPLLLVPWAFACLFLKRFLRRSAPAHRGDVTISESLAAAAAANKAEQIKLKTIGVMYLIALPAIAFCIWQLRSVGKVSSREMVSMVIFLGTALALSAAVLLARYWFGVAPEGQKLQGLLNQFGNASE